MDIVDSARPGGPALRMPRQVAGVARPSCRGAAVTGAGVTASGLSGFIDDLTSGDFSHMASSTVESTLGSIWDWLTS